MQWTKSIESDEEAQHGEADTSGPGTEEGEGEGFAHEVCTCAVSLPHGVISMTDSTGKCATEVPLAVCTRHFRTVMLDWVMFCSLPFRENSQLQEVAVCKVEDAVIQPCLSFTADFFPGGVHGRGCCSLQPRASTRLAAGR